MEKKLTIDVLRRADCITYYHDNGTVSPDCQYQCQVDVTPDTVSVRVYGAYGSSLKYDNKSAVEDSVYNKLLNFLAEQNIRKVRNNGRELECGRYSSIITVVAQGDTIFCGDEDVNLKIEKDRLFSPFSYILTPEQLDAAENPEKYLHEDNK